MNIDYDRSKKNTGSPFGIHRFLQRVLLFFFLSHGTLTVFSINPPQVSAFPDSVPGESVFEFVAGPPLELKWDHGPVSLGMVMDIGFISGSETDSSDLLISRIWSGLFRYRMPAFEEKLLMQTPDKLCDEYVLMFHPTEWTGDGISDLIAADRDGFIYLIPATGTPHNIRYEKTDKNVLRDHTGRYVFNIPFDNPGLPRQDDLGGYTDSQYSNYLFPRVYQCAGNRHKDLIIGDAAGNLWWMPDLSEGIGCPAYDGIVYSKQPTAHRSGSEYQSKFGLDYIKPPEKIEDVTGKPFLLGEGLESGIKFTGSMARPFLYPGQSGELSDLIVMAGAVRQKVSYLKRVNPPEERKPVFREMGEVTISGLDISLLNCHSRLCLIQNGNRKDLLLTSGNYIAHLEYTGDENGIPGFRFSGWISGEQIRASGYVFTDILTDTLGNRYVLDFNNYFWKPVRIIPGDEGITLHYASDSLRIFDQNGTFTVPGETDPQYSPAWGYHRISGWDFNGSGRQHLVAATDKGHLYLLEDDPALKKQDQFMYRSAGPLRDSTGKVIRVHNRAIAVAADLNDDGIDDLIVGGISYQLGIKSDPEPGGGIFYMLNLGTDTLGIPLLTPPLPLDVGHDFKPRINSHMSLQMFDLDHDGFKEMILSLQDKGWNGRIYSKVPGKTAFAYTGRQIPMESIVEQLIDIDGDGQCEIVRPGDETGVGYYRRLIRQSGGPEPLLPAYFPDRLHAFIWRNWQLIPAEKLAEVVKTSVRNINTIAFAMGLPPQENVTPELAKRSYVTIIKRNWHLLPYDQLLEFLGWKPEMLSATLMEDDFLFHKLGDIKPDCDPLRYTQPDETDADAERKIAQVIREEFPERIICSGDILFRFLDELKRLPDEYGSSLSKPKNSTIRICYSYYASFGDPLLDKEKDPYPEAYLQKLSECGINGIWISGILYKLSPFPWDSGLSRGYELRLQNLREIIDRAGKYGIGVYLYLNEPRAMPLSFFNDRPELKGVTEGGLASLCTGNAEVRNYIVSSVSHICRNAPGLAGIITITASEYLTNCWSHGKGGTCHVCSVRGPARVISDLNGLFLKGIRKAVSNKEERQRLIVWDWGWKEQDRGSIIQHLPREAAAMSVSEWGIPLQRGGTVSTVNEYCMSVVGPGDHATETWRLASRRGCDLFAKIQANNSWEISTVPYIPVTENVARHAANLRETGIEGIMASWTLGGYPSPNLDVLRQITENPGITIDSAMNTVAEKWFGKETAPYAVKAWCGYSRAFNNFPYHQDVVYRAPLQNGPSNLLWPEPTNYKSSMVGFAYDDLDKWRTVYPPEVFMDLLDSVSCGFDRTISELSGSISPEEHENTNLAREIDIARTVSIHMKSVSNQARFILLRDKLNTPMTYKVAAGLLDDLKMIIADETELAKELYKIQLHDSRIGFEASNQYYYLPVDLVEKVLNCRYLIDTWLPEKKKQIFKYYHENE